MSDPGWYAKSKERRRRVREMVAARSTINGRWSEAEVVALIRLREVGESTTNIALSLGRTHASVRSKISNMIRQGCASPVLQAWSPRDDRVLAEMYEAGDAPSRIAVALGRTPRSVNGRRAILGIPAIGVGGGSVWTAQDDDTLCRLYRAGCTIAEIADQLNRTPGSTGSRVRKLRRRGVQIPCHPAGRRSRVTANLTSPNCTVRKSRHRPVFVVNMPQ